MRSLRKSSVFWVLALLTAGWVQAWLETRWVALGVDRNPEAAVRRHTTAAAAAVRDRFARESTEAERIARTLAGSPRVRSGLAQPAREGSRELFAALLETGGASAPAGGIEILRADGSVAAWNGLTPVPGLATEGMGRATRRIEDGAIHLWFVVTVPVHESARGGAALGAVRVGVPVEARDRLHPRFRPVRTPTEAAREDTGAEVRIRRAPIGPETDGAAHVREPLDEADPALDAVIEIDRPLPEALFRGATRGARLRGRLLSAALLGVAFFVVAAGLTRRLATRPAWARTLLAVALPWGLRGALLALDLPGRAAGWAVLDENAYSNGAVGGLFSTPAEFLLTMGAALASATLLFRTVGAGGLTPRSGRGGALLGGGLTVAAAWAIALAVQSVVRDSTLEYFDPAEPIPPPAVLALLAGLFLLVQAAFLVVWAALPREGGRGRAPLFVAGILVAGTFALPVVPEMVGNFPFALGLGAFAAGAWLVRDRTAPQRVVLVALFAAGMLHLCFDAALDESRRRRILDAVPDVLGPSEAHYRLTVEEAAEGLADQPDVRALVVGWTESPPDRLVPIELWRRSIAHTGCDGLVLLKDDRGAVITSLSINFPAVAIWAPALDPLPTRTTSWARRLTDDDRIDLYAAQAPVLDAEGRPCGSVLVALSPPGRSVRSASFPEASRAARAPRERLPRVRVSRVGPGPTGAPDDLPWGGDLPAEVADRVGESEEPVWVRRPGGERPLETLFVRDAVPGGVAALTYEVPAGLPRATAFLSLFLWDSAMAMLLAAGVLVWQGVWEPRPVSGPFPVAVPAAANGAREAGHPAAIASDPAIGAPEPRGKGFFLSASARTVRRTAARFLGRLEHKILAFFLGVSLAPILVLSLFSRAVVSDRIEHEVGADALRAADLARRSLVLEREEAVRKGMPASTAVPFDPFCRRFAALTGKDLGIYVPGRLGATSKPELYELGHQPRRMPARAYVALTLEDGDAWLEDWTAGRHRYRIGFHALREAGRTAQVFAVPVLFNRREVDEETGAATTLIFGSYGIVVLLLWAGALVLAERLTRPLTQLVQGTRRIAAGDLEFRIRTEASGEFQELVDGFNRMTAELKQGRETLAKAEREAAWREMARQIAHEIKNPLTPMKLSAQEIARAVHDRDPETGEIVSSGVRTIVQQIDLLGRIASEFSTFARLPVGRRTAQDLNAIVRDTARLFEHPDPPAVAVALDLQDVLPAVVLDADEMRRVLTNLCKNATQAMPQGGTLTLRTRLARDGNRLWVRLRVSDSGQGIPREMIPRVFDPYFSTRSEGTGLGLAICRRIVEDLGGRISAHSREGEGATFTIELPAAPAGLTNPA